MSTFVDYPIRFLIQTDTALVDNVPLDIELGMRFNGLRLLAPFRLSLFSLFLLLLQRRLLALVIIKLFERKP